MTRENVRAKKKYTIYINTTNRYANTCRSVIFSFFFSLSFLLYLACLFSWVVQQANKGHTKLSCWKLRAKRGKNRVVYKLYRQPFWLVSIECNEYAKSNGILSITIASLKDIYIYIGTYNGVEPADNDIEYSIGTPLCEWCSVRYTHAHEPNTIRLFLSV